jgi:hypothetical protein
MMSLVGLMLGLKAIDHADGVLWSEIAGANMLFWAF